MPFRSYITFLFLFQNSKTDDYRIKAIMSLLNAYSFANVTSFFAFQLMSNSAKATNKLTRSEHYPMR